MELMNQKIIHLGGHTEYHFHNADSTDYLLIADVGHIGSTSQGFCVNTKYIIPK
jgi:hypothetical protein